MQAIVTKYFAPTTYVGARIVAHCEAKRRGYAWDYALDTVQNHIQAAATLAAELDWLTDHTLVWGSLPDGTFAHVLCKKTPQE